MGLDVPIELASIILVKFYSFKSSDVPFMNKLIKHQEKFDTISLNAALDTDNFDLHLFVQTVKPYKITNTKVDLLVYFSNAKYISLLNKLYEVIEKGQLVIHGGF